MIIPSKVKMMVLVKAMSNAPMTPFEKAVLLVIQIEAALADGTVHYDKKGNLLKTVGEILEALKRDGNIQFIPKDKQN